MTSKTRRTLRQLSEVYAAMTPAPDGYAWIDASWSRDLVLHRFQPTEGERRCRITLPKDAP